MKITMEWLEKNNACRESRLEFLAQSFKSIDGKKLVGLLIKKEKSDWANWLVVRLMSRKQQIRYAIYAAEQVVGIFEKKYPNDDRPRKAINSAKAYLKSPTKKNKDAANAAAHAAANAAYAAAYAAYAANAAAHAAADAAVYASNAADAANSKMKIKIINYGLKLLK
jgi:lipid A disaccharide synthetase